MKKLLFIMLAGSLLIFNSCTKTGPQGPVGPQGNANVKGSNPFDVTTWSYDGTEKAYVASFNDPDITPSVTDRGVVEIFVYYTSDKTWKPLPDIYGGTQFYFRYNDGGFDIYFGNVDGSIPLSPASFGSGVWTFRSVVISPSQKQAHPNTNWKNYNEVMSVLNSPEVKTTTISQ
jgi:hypothetical protein